MSVTTTSTTASNVPDVQEELLSLTLHLSEDGANWRTEVIEGESPDYVDTVAAAYLAERPAPMIQIDDDSTCWDLFPRTFSYLLQEMGIAEVPMAVTM